MNRCAILPQVRNLREGLAQDVRRTFEVRRTQGYNTTVVVKIDPTKSSADSLVYATYLGEKEGR